MAAAMPIFAGLSMLGTITSAQGQLQAGNVQAEIGEQNAQLAEANARQSDLSTADQLSQLARNTSITLGKQKAGFAKSGVKRTGTVLDVLTETVNLADRDQYRIKTAGLFSRQGFLTQAAQERYKGKVAKESSRIGAGSTLLTGFGSTALSFGLGKSGYPNSLAALNAGRAETK